MIWRIWIELQFRIILTKDFFWKHILKMGMPNKVKVFLRCACFKALPTRINLHVGRLLMIPYVANVSNRMKIPSMHSGSVLISMLSGNLFLVGLEGIIDKFLPRVGIDGGATTSKVRSVCYGGLVCVVSQK